MPWIDEAAELEAIGMLMDRGGPDSLEQSRDFLDSTNLQPRDFVTPRWSAGFQLMAKLIRAGDAATPNKLAAALAKNPQDRAELFRNLLAVRSGALFSKRAASELSEKLKRLTMLRDAERFLESSLKALSSSTTEGDLRRSAQAWLDAMASGGIPGRTVDADLNAILEEQDAIEKGERHPVIATGIDHLDLAIGGFRPTISVIAGAPGKGKSALMATAVRNIAKRFHSQGNGDRVGMMILEDDTKAITGRLLSYESRVPWGMIGSAPVGPDALGNMQTAAGKIAPYLGNVYGMDPTDEREITAERAVEVARDWIVNRKVRILFIDHLGEMRFGEISERHDLKVRAMLQTLREIAIQHRVPVVVLHHTNREAQRDGKPPQLHHLAESDYIGKMARLVLAVTVSQDDSAAVIVHLLKYNRGDMGTGSRGKAILLKRDLTSTLLDNAKGKAIQMENS